MGSTLDWCELIGNRAVCRRHRAWFLRDPCLLIGSTLDWCEPFGDRVADSALRARPLIGPTLDWFGLIGDGKPSSSRSIGNHKDETQLCHRHRRLGSRLQHLLVDLPPRMKLPHATAQMDHHHHWKRKIRGSDASKTLCPSHNGQRIPSIDFLISHIINKQYTHTIG